MGSLAERQLTDRTHANPPLQPATPPYAPLSRRYTSIRLFAGIATRPVRANPHSAASRSTSATSRRPQSGLRALSESSNARVDSANPPARDSGESRPASPDYKLKIIVIAAKA